MEDKTKLWSWMNWTFTVSFVELDNVETILLILTDCWIHFSSPVNFQSRKIFIFSNIGYFCNFGVSSSAIHIRMKLNNLKWTKIVKINWQKKCGKTRNFVFLSLCTRSPCFIFFGEDTDTVIINCNLSFRCHEGFWIAL